ESVEFARQANRLCFRHRMSYARFQQHAPNLICNSWTASIPQGSTISPSCPERKTLASQSFSLDSCTETGPFTVDSRIVAGPLPLLPSKLIGPFTAVISASPEKFFKLMGPFLARAVSFPSTSYKEIGPFIVSMSMVADFGARISSSTVHVSSSPGPFVEILPFSIDILICDRIRSASTLEPAAALHAVTE